MRVSQSGRSVATPAPDALDRRRPWLIAACIVLIAGLTLSGIAAGLWRASEQRRERQAFDSTAANVAATVKTLLLRDADWVATVQGVLTMQPQLTAGAFHAWFETLQAKRRQVGGLGTAVIRSVAPAQLDAFLARRDADPAFGALVGTPMRVSRSRRQRYCLLAAGGDLVLLDPPPEELLQGDWCDPASAIGTIEAPLLRTAADTGQFIAFSAPAQGIATMFLEAPVYRRGAVPLTAAAREEALVGWTISTVDTLRLLTLAAGRNTSLALAVYHRNPGQNWELIGQAGRPTRGQALTHTTAANIDGPWRIAVRGTPAADGWSAEQQGLLVFGMGAIATILSFLLVVVLGRSRERALTIVAEQTSQLRHQALHDALTGLPNRVLALDRAEQMLARARRAQRPMAALYVDVDSFKHINDTFGHAAGDQFLQIVAQRLESVIRESDTAARLAGDEFVVLLDNTTVEEGPQLVAERMLEVLREPYDMTRSYGRTLSLTASIGIAYGLHGSAEKLLGDADIALYVAKSAGKNRYVVFQSGMQTAAQDRLTLEMDLVDALGLEQLFLVYQPTFDLRTERAIGFEALLRWRHPTRGVIPPDLFVPIAEDSGLIVPIGRWVLEQACRQAAAWHAQGHALGISVNVSGRQLDRDDFYDDVRVALELSGLDASTLTLEITETALMRDAQASAGRLAALKELGVHIAIDDFGTGYSSLAYLREFSVDTVKIDRSFVRGVAGSPESAALIHTLVRLGKTLKLATLAEGIEDQEQLRALQREDCDQGQGFLFARPLEASAVEEFLSGQGLSAHASS